MAKKLQYIVKKKQQSVKGIEKALVLMNKETHFETIPFMCMLASIILIKVWNGEKEEPN